MIVGEVAAKVVAFDCDLVEINDGKPPFEREASTTC